MDASVLIAYTAACVMLALMPGVDIFYVLSQSLSKGFKTGAGITLGLCSGIVVHTGLCAAGLSVVIAGSPVLLNAVRVAGAGYLAYLALLAWKAEPAPFSRARASGGEFNFGKLYLRGFAMNISNPKVIIFFLSFFPQFITKGGFAVWAQTLVLGSIFMASALACFMAVAFAAERVAPLFATMAFAKAMRWLSIGVFASISASLVFEIFA